MPEYIRAYIVILTISSFALFFAKKLSINFLTESEFKKWRNSWLIITSMTFLSFNFWIFTVLTFLFVSIKRLRENNQIAFYVVILFASPPISQNIPGFGLMNYLMEINYLKVISLAILLPVAIHLFFRKNTLTFGAIKTDVFLMLYLLVNIGLQFRDTTFTDAIRQSISLLVQNFLPYYVISRSIESTGDIKKILVALMVASIPAAFVGIFEFLRHWLLYTTVESGLHIHWGYGGYLARDGALRAISSFGHPIVFGYFMSIALGVYLYLKDQIKSKLHRNVGLLIIILGLIAPISRGPWVGALAMFSVYLLLGKNALANIIKLGLFTILAFTLATQLPSGDRLINLIPFVGKTDSFNVDYREKLIDVSLLVVAKYPLFGKVDFRNEPEMRQMVQGEGIVDIVNTYISVLLSSGYIGLFSFMGIFISTIITLYRAIRKIKYVSEDAFQLGRMLLSTIIGSMVIISTVGDQLAVPYIYYILLATSVGLSNIIKIKYGQQIIPNQNLSALREHCDESEATKSKYIPL